MKCEDMLKLLSEYVDGEIDPGLCAEFEQHMAGCNPCQVVVDNIRKTIKLYKHDQPYELPEEFQKRLQSSLREKWKQKRADSSKDPGGDGCV